MSLNGPDTTASLAACADAFPLPPRLPLGVVRFLYPPAILGFNGAVKTLCTFPQDLLAELDNEVLDFLTYQVGAVDTEVCQKRLAVAGVTLPEEQVQGCINALVFTLR